MPRFSAGSASLGIVPNMDGFQKTLEAELAAMSDRLSVPVSADMSAATADLAAFQADLDRVGSESVAARVGVTDDGSAARFTADLRANLDAAVAGVPAVHIDGDATAVEEKIAAVGVELERLPAAKIAADSADADRTIAEIRANLDELSSRRIGIDMDAAAARAQLVEMRAQMDELATHADIRVRFDASEVATALSAAEARLAEFEAKASKDGDGSGGAFADAFRKRVEAAVASLPAVRLDGDSTAVEQKIAAVRAELQDLSGKTIGIDLSDEAALAKVRELQAVLDEVAHGDYSAQLKTDSAAASADLARFQAELDKINGETATANVKVNDDGSTAKATTGIQGLMQAAMLVAPAIVPIGAVAAAAGGAILGMGTVGIGALGTLALGFGGVTDATKLLTTEQTATGDALAKVEGQIASLDPATRNFAEYLVNTVHPAFKNLQDTAAAGLLPGVQAGIEAASGSLPQLTGLVGTLATSMGGLAREAGQALGGPFWQNFLTMIQGQAGPIVTDFGHTLGNLATGFAGITEAFLPMARNLSDGLAGLSTKFADFGKNLASSSGFATFTAYVQTEWPVVKDIIENVATAVGHLIQAGAPLGVGMLGDLRLISQVLAALPVPVVEALALAFSAVKLNSAIAGPIQAAASAVEGFATKAAGLSTNLEGAAKSGETATSGLGKFGSAVSGIGSALPIVGTAVAVAFGVIDSAIQAHNQKIQEGANQILSWKEAVAQGGAAADTAQQHLTDLSAKMTSLNAEIAKTSTSWGNEVAAVNPVTGGYSATGQAAADLKTKHEDLQAELKKAQAAWQAEYDKMTPVQKAQADLNRAIAEYGPNSDQAKAAVDRLTGAQNSAKASADAQAQAIDGVNRAMLTEQQRILDVEGASVTYRQALDSVNTAHQASVDALAKYGPASAQYKTAVLGEESAMLQASQAAGTLEAARHKDLDTQQQQALSNAAQLIALNDLKNKYGELPPELEKTRQGLLGTVSQGDLATVSFDNLGLKVKAVPDKKTIIVDSTTPAVDKQLTDLGVHVTHMPDGTVKLTGDTAAAEAAIDYTARNRTVTITTQVVGGQGVSGTTAQNNNNYSGTPIPGNAAGGHITGPGTGTSDSIPAMLSNGEFVIKAASVSQYGVGLMHAINDGQYTPGTPGFASGGLVSVPVPPPVQHFATGGSVSANWGGTINLAPGDISPLAQFWADALNDIANISANARTAISGQFQGLSTDVTSAVTGIPAAVAGPWGQVTNAMTTGANNARTGVATAFAAMPAAVIGPVTQTQAGASQQFALLAANVAGSSTQAQSTASQQFAVLNTNAVGSATTAQAGVSGQWGLIAQNVSANATQAQATGSAQTGTLRDNVISAMTLAQSGTTQQWTAILAAVTSNATQAQGTGTAQTGTLRDNVISAMTTAQTTATAQWATFRTNISADSTTAQTVATQQTGTLRDNVSSALTTAQTTGTAQWATFRTNISADSTTAQTVATAQTGTLRDNVVAAVTTAQTNATAQWATLRTNFNGTSTGLATDTTATFTGLDPKVTGATKTTVTNASNAFAGIRPGFANPTDYVVNTVLNNGLFKAFNAVGTAVALPNVIAAVNFTTAGANTPIAAADGGHIPGWSPHDKADNIPAMLTAGEFVQPVATVKKYGVGFMESIRSGDFPVDEAQRYADGGHVTNGLPIKPKPGAFVVGPDIANFTGNFLEALNAGQAEAVQAVVSRRFANGGQVTHDYTPPMERGAYVVGDHIGPMAANFLAALDNGSSQAIQAAGGFFARGPQHFAAGGLVYAQQIAAAMNGQPYVWGGVGPNGADCSGYQSVITNALRGAANVYSRVGTTATFPWAGFTPGMTSSYAVGSIPDAGGGVGHMAGTLGGVNAESGGAHGNVAYGGPAAGADAALFTIHASLPESGGVFASGGGGGGTTVLVPQLLGGQWADTAAVLAYLNGSFTPANDAITGKFPPDRGQIQTMHGVAPKELDVGWNGALKAKVDAWFAAHPPVAQTVAGSTGTAVPYSGGGAAQWKPQVDAVLGLLGRGTGEEGAVLRRIDFESGGNPNAINLTDSNAIAGHPSQGLMQVIPSTFAAYRDPALSSNILDPEANIYAGSNYAIHRYGSLAAIDPLVMPSGYAEGGLVTPPSLYDNGGWLPPGLTTVYNGTGQHEAVRTADQERALMTSIATQRDSTRGRDQAGPASVHVYLSDRELTELVDMRVEYRQGQDGLMMRSSM